MLQNDGWKSFLCPPEVRGVEDNAHQTAGEGTRDGDGHEPGESQQTDSLPVDGAPGSVAQADSDGGAGDAHGGGDGELVLGEQEDGDGGAHFHGGATGRGVVGDLVAHDFHDIVAVGDQANGEGGGEDGQLPNGDFGAGFGGVAGVPGRVDDGPGADGVADVVGAVGERGSAGGDDLDV